MNRKDLEAITRAIKNLDGDISPSQKIRICQAILKELDGNCASFDRQKFLKRCGVKDGT